MKKKCFLLVLLITVLFSFQVVSAEVDYTKEADMLNSLGLFNGTQNGYELDRVPTRVESAAMLVRLLGAEKEANEMKFEHPFTDVPEWANNIVGYMYEKGYTKGISDNLFGSSQTTIARDYTTFMLRSLGYSSNSDFNYLEAIDFATAKGIITSDDATNLNEVNFKRNEMILLSYKTLNANLKDSEDKLLVKLSDNGAINKQEAFKQGLVNSYETVISGLDSNLDKLEVNSPIVYIYAEKKEIDNGDTIGFDMEKKEYFTDGYDGRISFKKGISNWEGLNIKFQLSFYNEGKYVKKMEFLYYSYNGENDFGNGFKTPNDKFDEIRIVASPIDYKEITNGLDGVLEVITTNDTKLLKETIITFGNVHATSNGDSRRNFKSDEVVNAFAWETIYGGVTIYEDGSVYRSYAHKYIIDGDFNLEFNNEGSSIGTEGSKRIIGLPKNDFDGRINLILIFDEGFKIEKAFLVK